MPETTAWSFSTIVALSLLFFSPSISSLLTPPNDDSRRRKSASLSPSHLVCVCSRLYCSSMSYHANTVSASVEKSKRRRKKKRGWWGEKRCRHSMSTIQIHVQFEHARNSLTLRLLTTWLSSDQHETIDWEETQKVNCGCDRERERERFDIDLFHSATAGIDRVFREKISARALHKRMLSTSE